jgi:hypothetical protein
MTTHDSSAMLVVYDGRETAGFLLRRGKVGVEAFDRDCVGLFPSESEAANAITSNMEAAS